MTKAEREHLRKSKGKKIWPIGTLSSKLKEPTFTGETIYIEGEEIDVDALIRAAHQNNRDGSAYTPPPSREQSSYLGSVTCP